MTKKATTAMATLMMRVSSFLLSTDLSRSPHGNISICTSAHRQSLLFIVSSALRFFAPFVLFAFSPFHLKAAMSMSEMLAGNPALLSALQVRLCDTVCVSNSTAVVGFLWFLLSVTFLVLS